MEKLRKTASALDRFFRFAYCAAITCTVFGGIVILFLWYLYLGDHTILNMFHMDLDFGMIKFQIANSVASASNLQFLYLSLGSIVGLAQVVVFCMIFRAIRGILAPIKESRPFHEDIVHYLKQLGWLTIAGGVINNLGNLIVYGNLLLGYDLDALFISETITEVTTNYAFNFTFLIYAVILFLLSYIFQYGGELQQLSDETL